MFRATCFLWKEENSKIIKSKKPVYVNKIYRQWKWYGSKKTRSPLKIEARRREGYQSSLAIIVDKEFSFKPESAPEHHFLETFRRRCGWVALLLSSSELSSAGYHSRSKFQELVRLNQDTRRSGRGGSATVYRLEDQETNNKVRIMSAVNNIKGGERRVAASGTKGVGSESRQTLWRLSPCSTMLINERRAAPEIPAALTILNQRWYSWAPLSPNSADNSTPRLAWVMQTKYRTFNERKYRDASAKRFFTVPRDRRQSFHRVGWFTVTCIENMSRARKLVVKYSVFFIS